MMFPIKPLSTHPDAGTGHVAGSQRKADKTIVNNCRKAAMQIVVVKAMIFLCMAAMIGAAVAAIARGGQ